MSKQSISRGVSLPRLRELREGAGIKLCDLSRDTGYDYTFLWKLENGKAKAGYHTVKTLSRRLETTEEQLTAAPAVQLLH